MSIVIAKVSNPHEDRAMNHRTAKPFQESLDNGWSVQIYSHDRRLLCSLYPSHGWAFFMGILLGFFLAIVGLQGQLAAHSPAPELTPKEAPLNLD